MSDDELKVIEVKNKLTGGKPFKDFDWNCPWCDNSEVEYEVEGSSGMYSVEYGKCHDCGKEWEVTFKRICYEEI